VSHSYQTYFGFPGSDLNLDCGLRDHEVRIKKDLIQPYLGHEARRKYSKGNKSIILQLGNNMGDYLFLLFLGLMGCMEGYEYALN